MSQILDKETREVIFDSEVKYTLRQFIKIAKKSPEGKKMYKGDYNFGKGIKMAEYLRKNLPNIAKSMKARVFRSAWNYGDNLMVIIELGGERYDQKMFSFDSANSTRQPRYSFSKLFNGTIKPSTNKQGEWGMGVVHGSYQSISNFDQFMSDVVGVFNDYERVKGVPFDVKGALAQFKKNAKILDQWNKLKPKIEKQYDIAKENARKVDRYIELRMPYIRTSEKTVYYKTDEPRELRHPDEYGSSAYSKLDSKEYQKYEEAQAKISDMIEKFCAKHGFNFTWAASW